MAKTSYISSNGMIIGEMTSGVMRAYGPDALGSVVATYTTGAVENGYQYKPYGGTLAKTGVAADPAFLWNGGSGYRATTLTNSDYYVRRRKFSSTSGQWNTVDPMWPRQPAYGYVRGNPVRWRDPSGLDGDEVVGTLKPKCVELDPNSVCGSSHCQGGTWGNCPKTDGKTGVKSQCLDPNNLQKNCQAIAVQIGGVDKTLGGGGDDTSANAPWQACTYCCQSDNSDSFKTVCCSSASPRNPCVMYCILEGHEKDGHGRQQCNNDLGAGGRDNELAALVCERACLMNAWGFLNCSQFGAITPPPTRAPKPFDHATCNVDRNKYF